MRDIVPGLAWLSEKLTGFSARRPLPRWQRRWFRNHELPNSPAHKSSSTTVKPPVLLFIDSFNRYFEPENIRAAVRVLQAAGYDVFTPLPDGSKQPLCCGRTFLSTGMIDRARHEAKRLVTAIAPFAKLDIPIVGLEPSCTLALRDEIPAGISSRSAKVHDGSNPTIGISSLAKGAIAVTSRLASWRARSIMPVDKKVRPQQSGCFDPSGKGVKTSYPAACKTLTAARIFSGSK